MVDSKFKPTGYQIFSPIVLCWCGFAGQSSTKMTQAPEKTWGVSLLVMPEEFSQRVYNPD